MLHQILPADLTAHRGTVGHRRVRFVEFGSGTGNLLLPLAHLMPSCTFHAVDIKVTSAALPALTLEMGHVLPSFICFFFSHTTPKEAAVELLLSRAEEAGLTNVTASVERIEVYRGERTGPGLLLTVRAAYWMRLKLHRPHPP